MKVKLSDLQIAFADVPRLASADLCARGLSALTKAIKVITSEVQEAEIIRQKLIDQYAQKDDKGKILQLANEVIFKSPDDRQKFLDEWKSLREGEIELNVQEIPWRYLIGKTFRPVPGDFIALSFMLKEPDEKELEEMDKLLGRE